MQRTALVPTLATATVFSVPGPLCTAADKEPALAKETASDAPAAEQEALTILNWAVAYLSGADSQITDRDFLPVVKIAYEDAGAFAKWSRKRLPTEAEWESAAGGGQPDRPYA